MMVISWGWLSFRPPEVICTNRALSLIHIYLYVGGDQHLVADGDPVAVHERAARIDGDVVSDMDVAAVIADEGLSLIHI